MSWDDTFAYTPEYIYSEQLKEIERRKNIPKFDSEKFHPCGCTGMGASAGFRPCTPQEIKNGHVQNPLENGYGIQEYKFSYR